MAIGRGWPAVTDFLDSKETPASGPTSCEVMPLRLVNEKDAFGGENFFRPWSGRIAWELRVQSPAASVRSLKFSRLFSEFQPFSISAFQPFQSFSAFFSFFQMSPDGLRP